MAYHFPVVQIFMGGRNTIVMHNTCEDSLLAAPIILDLVILTELLTRIQACKSFPYFHRMYDNSLFILNAICRVSSIWSCCTAAICLVIERKQERQQTDLPS